MDKRISRKSFLKAAAGLAASLTAAGGLAYGETEGAAPFEAGIPWDAEFDVVVVGYGLAGAVTAVTACDQGASVLLLDKCPRGQEGGNSRVAGQGCFAPYAQDEEKIRQYFKALRGAYDSTGDEILEAMVSGLMGVRPWFERMVEGTSHFLADLAYPEYPEYPGAEAAILIKLDDQLWTSRLYTFAQELVAAREGKGLRLWYGCPCKKLVQDPDTGIVHGLEIENQGERYLIRAKNGVVLSCGGFENNERMIENYLQLPYAYSKGAKYNTGDGIVMAMEAGANLWHMGALAGPDVAFKAADMPIVFGYALQGGPSATGERTGICAENVIFVGADGSRFVNEAEGTKHGHVNYSGTWKSMMIPTPCYMVFDESARLSNRVYFAWSEGCVDEIEKGWVKKADTIEELAALAGISPAGLKEQVEFYNECCKNGSDIAFKRAPESLKPLETPPFYAFELSPCFTNTQGGPERNPLCQVVNYAREPIPHLYSAGELGSFYADLYNGGGNLAECIFTGCTAGREASLPKEDVTGESLCLEARVDFSYVPQEIALQSNQRSGSARGIGGDIVLVLTMDGERIAKAEVALHNETIGYGSRAIEAIPPMMAGMGAEDIASIDNIAGATVTSMALKGAALSALAQG